MSRGGKRPGAGRPKKEPTTTIRVPVSKLDQIKKIIKTNIMETKEIEEIQVCPHCGADAEERFIGDEGFTFCTDGCGCIEGEKPVYRLPS